MFARLPYICNFIRILYTFVHRCNFREFLMFLSVPFEKRFTVIELWGPAGPRLVGNLLAFGPIGMHGSWLAQDKDSFRFDFWTDIVIRLIIFPTWNLH